MSEEDPAEEVERLLGSGVINVDRRCWTLSGRDTAGRSIPA
jgi:hypothetical protein